MYKYNTTLRYKNKSIPVRLYSFNRSFFFITRLHLHISTQEVFTNQI